MGWPALSLMGWRERLGKQPRRLTRCVGFLSALAVPPVSAMLMGTTRERIRQRRAATALRASIRSQKSSLSLPHPPNTYGKLKERAVCPFFLAMQVIFVSARPPMPTEPFFCERVDLCRGTDQGGVKSGAESSARRELGHGDTLPVSPRQCRPHTQFRPPTLAATGSAAGPGGICSV